MRKKNAVRDKINNIQTVLCPLLKKPRKPAGTFWACWRRSIFTAEDQKIVRGQFANSNSAASGIPFMPLKLLGLGLPVLWLQLAESGKSKYLRFGASGQFPVSISVFATVPGTRSNIF